MAASFVPVDLNLQGRNTIFGHVFDDAGRPVTEIYVELMTDVYSTLARTKTDGSGRYYFRQLSQGNFKVKVLPFGKNFKEQVQDVSITNFNVAGGAGTENAQLDFYLKEDRRRGQAELIGTGGAIFTQDVPEAARRKYEEGVEDLVKNRVDEGMAKLKQSIELFPSYYFALDRLGIEFVKRQEYEAAILVLTKAVEVNPRSSSSQYGLGLANYNLKRMTAALEALQRAAFLNPQSVNTQLWLGITLRQTGKLQQAETALKQAKELTKKASVPEVHWQLALLFNKLARYGEAADELEVFLKVQPDSRDVELIKKLIQQLRSKAK